MKYHLAFLAIVFSLTALFFIGCADSTEDTTPTDVPPAAPSNLAATQTLRTQVGLSWGNVADEDTFVVQRSMDTTLSWAALANVGQDVLAATDQGIHANRKHWYRVASKNIAGVGDYSAPVSIWTWPAVFNFSVDQTDNFDAFSIDGPPDYHEWVWDTPNTAAKLTITGAAAGQFTAAVVSNDTMSNRGWFEFNIKIASWFTNGAESPSILGYYIERDPAVAQDVVGIKFSQDSTKIVYYTASGMTVVATNPTLPLMTDATWHRVQFFHLGDQWTVRLDGNQIWNGSIPNVAVGTYGLIQEWQLDRGDDPNDQSIWLDDVANSDDSPLLLQSGETHSPHRSTLNQVRRPVKK